jgi:SEFIR domain
VAKVFISYTHDSDAHRESVRIFAEKLVDDLKGTGIEVITDHDFPPGGPDIDFRRWSEQHADRCEILIPIFNATYRKCWDGEHPAGVRNGGTNEATVIAARVNTAGGALPFIRAVVFDEADKSSIPSRLVNMQWFLEARDYHDIVGWVKHAVSIVTSTAPVSATPLVPPIAWPSSIVFPPDALADRRDQCGLFCDMLTGVAPVSVACIIAGSGTGKTKLLKVFRQVAAAALAGRGSVAYLKNLQEQKSICELVGALCSALGSYPAFPRYEQSVADARPPASQHLAFLHDLRVRSAPSLLILDTWDKGTEELRQWIIGHLVPAVLSGPGVKLIIAGQPSAEFPSEQPDAIRHCTLSDITRDDWHQFIDVRYTGEATTIKPMIDLCMTKAHGVKTIANILDLLEKGDLGA